MSLARFISLLITLLWWAAGLYGFMTAVGAVTAYSLLIGGFALGAIAGSRVFDRLASPVEKLRDLQDRVRNQDVSS